MAELRDNPKDPQDNLDDLVIVELDERLEFGVVAIASAIAFDSNSSNCTNPNGCTNGSCPTSTNQSNCHNGQGC